MAEHRVSISFFILFSTDIDSFIDLLNHVNFKKNLIENSEDIICVKKSDLVESFRFQNIKLKREILERSTRPISKRVVEIDVDTKNKLERAFEKQYEMQNIFKKGM